jgi:phosphoribosyl 1,2-cyclic phosphodiesterase
VRLRFLGTGASGGTPGTGRSRRRESSLLVDAGRRLLIDVTRDWGEQQRELDGPLDAILLTHGHRDACGGIAALRPWLRERSQASVPVHASRQTIAVVRRRVRRLDHCEFVELEPHRRVRSGNVMITAVTVPHARERHIPTYAWRLTAGRRSVVYASDVARLTPELRRFARGAAILVIDAAMWGRSLFSHLTIDRELPGLCDWAVDRVVLTQIGRTAPPHRELRREALRLCPKALPAYDGLSLAV